MVRSFVDSLKGGCSAVTLYLRLKATTDFYVCGSAAMVADCRSLLEKAGALYIHTEVY